MADIDITQLTNATAINDGTGIFDVLVQAVERRIEAQFTEGRITGADYANVYLGSMQSVLQQSMQFLLQEQQSGLQADQIRSATEDQRSLTEAQLEKQWGYDVTRDGTTGDIILGASTNTGIIDEQLETQKRQTDQAVGQTAKSYAEVALIGQKQESELAQTSDPTGGILLAQKNLYEAQIIGFKGKHKNELIKNMIDGFSVVYSISDANPPTGIGFPGFLEGNQTLSNKMTAIDNLVAESDVLFD